MRYNNKSNVSNKVMLSFEKVTIYNGGTHKLLIEIVVDSVQDYVHKIDLLMTVVV